MYHDGARRASTAEINSSLHALKECIRMRSERKKRDKHVHIPYRAHNLTKVLKASLDDPAALTTVIVTPSPGVSDTENSMSTLDTVLMISRLEKVDKTGYVREVADCASAKEVVPVAKWKNEKVGCFDGVAGSAELGDLMVKEIRAEVEKCAAMEKKRREAVMADKNDRKNMASVYTKALAPQDPNAQR